MPTNGPKANRRKTCGADDVNKARKYARRILFTIKYKTANPSNYRCFLFFPIFEKLNLSTTTKSITSPIPNRIIQHSNMSAARFALMKPRVAMPTLTPSAGFLATRTISSTAARSKGPVEATKDTLKKADRTVSDAAIKGLNKGGMSSSL